MASDAASSRAEAGRTHFPREQILAFAEKVETTLAAHGAQVAILARMGRPTAALPPGMRFTHVAFAVYTEHSGEDGRTLSRYVIHNLYQLKNAPDRSELVQDLPADFFAEVFELEAGIIVPPQDLQQRLLKLIASPDYASLHESSYSVIANPYCQGRQNCTEFVLDVVNAAIYQTLDPDVLKTTLKARFVPHKVDVSLIKLKLVSLFVREVSLDDHDGTPVTSTFESIGRYLQQYDQRSVVVTVRPD